MAGHLIVILSWSERERDGSYGLDMLPLYTNLSCINKLSESSRVLYKPLETPFVERQPCHSLNSLLWQHSPSGPMAAQVKTE